MRTTVVLLPLLSMFCGTAATGQTTAQPAPAGSPSLAQPTTRPMQPQGPSPDQRRLSTSAPAAAGTLPGFAATTAGTNQLGAQGVVTTGNLNQVLLSLQAEIERALPLIATLSSGSANAHIGATTTTPGVGVTAGAQTSATTPTTPSVGPPNVTPGPQTSFLPPTGTNRGIGALQTQVQGIGGNATTNVTGNTPGVDPSTLQLLQVLQINLQQSLPLLQSLTGTLNAGAAAGTTGGLSPTDRTLQSPQQDDRAVILPTGR